MRNYDTASFARVKTSHQHSEILEARFSSLKMFAVLALIVTLINLF